MKKQTVHQLRKTGWKVKVGHKRLIFKFDPKTGIQKTNFVFFKDIKESYSDYYLSAKGGITEVCVTSPSGDTRTGYSYCNEDDHYDCSIGLDIALGRVLRSFQDDV